MAKIQKKNRLEAAIPTSSMSDIAFLLLLFFMVSTVFVKEKKQDVILPKADEKVISKIDRKNATTIYIKRDGKILIDDMVTPVTDVEYVMRNKVQQNLNLLTAFRTDKNTAYSYMNDVMLQLRKADALRIFFETKKKGT